MTGLLGALVAQGIGVAMSPLAVVVLLALLGTRNARVNGPAFVAGWVAATVAVLLAGVALVRAFGGGRRGGPPAWLGPLHLVLAALLVAGAVVVWRRGRAKVLQAAFAPTAGATVVAAPALPAWLASVERFRPGRCALIGAAAFLLNPVDVSCTVGAAVDVATIDVGAVGAWIAAAVFVVIGSAAVAGPVAWYLAVPDRAAASLQRLQAWIARRTHVVNAVVIGLIGVMQLGKGVNAL
ncbi:GAP family protein [Geodermatophilus sp. SYSU D00766]